MPRVRFASRESITVDYDRRMRAAAAVVLAACTAPTSAPADARDPRVPDAAGDAPEGPCEVTQVPSCPNNMPARILDVFPRNGLTCGMLGQGGGMNTCPDEPTPQDVMSCGGFGIPRTNSCGVRIEVFARKPFVAGAQCLWEDIEPVSAVILHVTEVRGGGARLDGLDLSHPTPTWFRVRSGYSFTSVALTEHSVDGQTWTPDNNATPTDETTSYLWLNLKVALSSNQPIEYEHDVIELAEAIFVCP